MMGTALKKKIGNILESNFVDSLSGDMFYGNELFGDIPNRFIYKNKNRLYDIWIRTYSKNRLPKLIEKTVKNILQKIYYKNSFPEIFTPDIGKLLAFDIALKRPIFNRELEYHYQNYPDKSIIAIADGAFEVLSNIYERIPRKGTILFHDYGFFLPENRHLIENFLRPDNVNNPFVRNYYGEFTTDPSFDFLYYKFINYVNKISIKKTVDRVSEITNTPSLLINLDGDERKVTYFIDLIRERFEKWNITEKESIGGIVNDYINGVKTGNPDVDNVVLDINEKLNNTLSEDRKLTIKKILLGYFNDDDHRFLTIEINK